MENSSPRYIATNESQSVNYKLCGQVSEPLGHGIKFWSPRDVSGSIVFMALGPRN